MVGTLKVGTLMIGTMVLALSLGTLPAAAQPGAPPVPDSRALLHALEDAFTSVADRVTPSVVNVSVKPKKGAPGESGQTPESEQPAAPASPPPSDVERTVLETPSSAPPTPAIPAASRATDGRKSTTSRPNPFHSADQSAQCLHQQSSPD